MSEECMGESRKEENSIRLDAIYHRCALTDCYCLDENRLMVHIRTGKEITAVYLVYGDPYSAGISASSPWDGEKIAMTLSKELHHSYIWEVVVTPIYKRMQYYFEIICGKESVYLLEDDFYTKEELNDAGRRKQYFKFAWMNESDIIKTPAWAEDTIWYQIMPDRFAKGTESLGRERHHAIKEWNDHKEMTYRDFYGGNLEGIIEKLPYLKSLGISGIYLTPIFESDSNHKYNTTDYTRIDPDFGTEETMMELIQKAHALNIRVMIDAVLNHCGKKFFAWQDVMEKGKKSAYFDWFYINKWPIEEENGKTKDGRYYSFAFEAGMPKLNTNNPKVREYFLQIGRHWIEEWKVDGIRFDVGNEVAHTFLKQLRREFKSLNPDLYLLGEIWNDAISWLSGDEYDSVMNYPFIESIEEFWRNEKWDVKRLIYSVNRCYSLYSEQINGVLFNFLDTHDTERAISRCGNEDAFFQELAFMMTMQGSPCLYYGTEIAMEGDKGPYNRKCMPWDEMADGKYDEVMRQVRQLIALRNENAQAKSSQIIWDYHKDSSRMIHYIKSTETCGRQLEVYMNAGEDDVLLSTYRNGAETAEGKILFSRHYRKEDLEERLNKGGVLVRLN